MIAHDLAATALVGVIGVGVLTADELQTQDATTRFQERIALSLSVAPPLTQSLFVSRRPLCQRGPTGIAGPPSPF